MRATLFLSSTEASEWSHFCWNVIHLHTLTHTVLQTLSENLLQQAVCPHQITGQIFSKDGRKNERTMMLTSSVNRAGNGFA